MQSELTDTYKPLRLAHLAVALLLFCSLVALSFPYYRYFIDPDAVAYLSMARSAAAGEPLRLVNALWSPLHPAVVSVLIRAGLDGLLAAQLSNAAACVLILILSWALFRRFRISRGTALPLLLALSCFLTYALYKQLFCDLPQVALLLAYLLIICEKNFLQRPWLWLLCALVTALAAYAKVYSFYFLLLHFPLALALIRRGDLRRRFPLKTYAIVFSVQLLLLLPLVLLMHAKYGFWSLSKSGALNTSWTLVGHKSPRPDIQALIPPPYPNSPYTWEDPYLSEGVLHTRFESLAMIKSQVGHSILASLQAVEAASQISPFLLIVLLASVAAVLSRRDTGFSTKHQLLLLAAGIMPMGYLLLHVEARYLWLLLFAGMLLGATWLERLRSQFAGRRGHRVAAWIFAASFVVWPVHDMKKLYRGGADARMESMRLQALGIKGGFTSNDNPSRSGLLAYWLDGNFYTPISERPEPAAVLADMRRYRVKYYFAYNRSFDATEPWFLDEQGRPFPELSGGRIPGMRVFLVNP